MALLAMMTGVALILSVVESMLPININIPGVKIGLPNVITLFLVLNADKKSAFIVLLLRVVLSSIFAGQVMTFCYSLVGGLLCLFAMSFINFILKGNPVWFISLIGAIFHNIGQIAVAVCFMSWSVIAYLPILIITGCIAGVLTGIVTDLTCRKMKKSGVLAKIQRTLGKHI